MSATTLRRIVRGVSSDGRLNSGHSKPGPLPAALVNNWCIQPLRPVRSARASCRYWHIGAAPLEDSVRRDRHVQAGEINQNVFPLRLADHADADCLLVENSAHDRPALGPFAHLRDGTAFSTRKRKRSKNGAADLRGRCRLAIGDFKPQPRQGETIHRRMVLQRAGRRFELTGVGPRVSGEARSGPPLG